MAILMAQLSDGLGAGCLVISPQAPLQREDTPSQWGRGAAQAWKPGSQHAGEKRGVAGLLLGRTERAARAAELQLCAQAR